MPGLSDSLANSSQLFGWQGWLAIIIFALVFIFLVIELFPPDLTMVMGSGALVICGIITPQHFALGFANPILITLIMLFVIVKSLEVNGALTFFSKKLMPKTNGTYKQILKLMSPLSFTSAFLNNIPLVLMMTPVVRKWASDQGKPPSKFLILISYATILGGACTLIGTSSNLAVDGMLKTVNAGRGLKFFELAWIGVPCLVAGYFYLLLIGRHLLPKRENTQTLAPSQIDQFANVLEVAEDCPLVGKSVALIDEKYFKGVLRLIEIERDGVIYYAPSTRETIKPNDKLIVLADAEELLDIQAIKGLQVITHKHHDFDYASSHLFEAVVSVGSSFVGKTIQSIDFRNRFNATILGVYREGKRIEKNLRTITLYPGDTLVLLAKEDWEMHFSLREDLYILAGSKQKMSIFIPKRCIWIFTVIVLMIIAAGLGVSIMIASMVAAFLLLIFRSLSIAQARSSIHWDLIILIGSAFSLGHGLIITGVADYLAKGFLSLVGYNPHLFIGGIMLITLIVTELITNNAAALLVFPIAFEATNIAGYHSPTALIAVAVTIAVGATYSFITPIGYQTNTIVYGPGGYKFIDYAKIGLPLSCIVLVISALLIPKIWPLTVG